MSIIENAERYMKRYDYLMAKRERRYSQGKRLSPEEDGEKDTTGVELVEQGDGEGSDGD